MPVLAAAILAYATLTAQANNPYNETDTRAAITDSANEFGLPPARLTQIIRCETGGTFDPYSIGRQGELGAAQLHPRGKLPDFYSAGYDDPFNPYQAVRFLAQQIILNNASAWSCA